MKTFALYVAAALIVTSQEIVLAQHHHGGSMSSSEKNPTLAAVLSLQPLPVDLGSFYAGNWERGILYTVAEAALFIPAMVMLSGNSNVWGHHHSDAYYYSDTNRRTGTHAMGGKFYYLLGGYLLVKAISAFDAGHSVARQNATMMLGYDYDTKSVALLVSVPLGVFH